MLNTVKKKLKLNGFMTEHLNASANCIDRHLKKIRAKLQ